MKTIRKARILSDHRTPDQNLLHPFLQVEKVPDPLTGTLFVLPP
jgi:hypothetical protein